MRKSRAEALKRRRLDKFAGFFGLSSKPIRLPKSPESRPVPAEAKPIKIRAMVEEEEPLQFTEDGTLIAQRVKEPASTGLLAMASILPVDRERIEEARDEARRGSRRTALIVSVVAHLFLLAGLATFVLPGRPEPPQMVVGVPEKELADEEEQQQKKLENISEAPKPKASISLPKVVSNMVSPVAAPTVDVLSDENLGIAAMPATGLGLGRGKMNFGANFDGMAIGGMMIRSKKLGVVLDTSPSMTPYLPELRAEIRQNFRGSIFKEIKGCTLAATNGRDSTSIVTFYDPAAVMMGIKELVTEHRIDALYWFCDLQDQQTDAALDELEKMLTGTFPGRRVRFYVRSLDLKPSKRLEDIILRSGGEAEVGPIGL